MSAEYSVEEVLESARKAAASNGRAKEASMLFAYAERIKADRGMVPDSMIVLLNHIEGLMDSGILPEDVIPVDMWNAVSMHNITHPPAQAAQDDGMCNADNPARRCVCREEFGRRVCGTASPAVTQDGWKVVPRDPTPEMIAACISAWQERLRQKAESGTLLCGGNPEKSFRDNWTAMLDAAPSAPAGVPEWRVLVPREPTDAMCDAGDLPDTATAYDIYKAMLAAAPQPGESA